MEQIEAIRSQRLLLEKVRPGQRHPRCFGRLRHAVQKGRADYEAAFSSAMASLAGNSMWVKVAPVDQEAIKAAVGLKRTEQAQHCCRRCARWLSRSEAFIEHPGGDRRHRRTCGAGDRARGTAAGAQGSDDYAVGWWIWLPAGALWARPAICGALDRASVNSDAELMEPKPMSSLSIAKSAEPQERHTQEGERQIERDNSAQGPVHRGHRQETAAVC